MSKSEDSLRQKAVELRALAGKRHLRLKITAHARKRMQTRNISEFDIRSILKTGNIVKIEQQEKGEVWKVGGTTDDGQDIVVVIAPEINIIRVRIITTWKKKQQNN